MNTLIKDWLSYLQWSKFRGRWRAGRSASSRVLMEMAPWSDCTIQHIVTLILSGISCTRGQHNNQLRPLLLPSCWFHTTFGDHSCHIKIAPSYFDVEKARSTSTTLSPPPHSSCFLFCPLFSFLGALLKENSGGERGEEDDGSCGLAAQAGMSLSQKPTWTLASSGGDSHWIMSHNLRNIILRMLSMETMYRAGLTVSG